jgi:hypothetical protein
MIWGLPRLQILKLRSYTWALDYRQQKYQPDQYRWLFRYIQAIFIEQNLQTEIVKGRVKQMPCL